MLPRRNHGQTEYSWLQGHALYLVGPARRSVLRILLKPSETITGDWYRTQLMRLSRALKDKRPQYNERHDKVILQHDNARPLHVAKVVKTYLETLNGKSYPTRRILQTLLPLTITCFDQWHMAWLTSTSGLMKK